ncbi:MAG: cyclic nucleotide-binding protein [Firmicutes bacterium]|nr:cyclic nucleotide-binding protein [Bacillota bacterium]
MDKSSSENRLSCKWCLESGKCMDQYTESLRKCAVFNNIDEKLLIGILNGVNARITSYTRNQSIAFEGDECSSIGILLDGHIEIQKIFLSGKTLTISTLSPGDTFGEVIVFSNMRKYPSTIVSSSASQVLYISRDDIVQMCSSEKGILKNFMELLSNKILMLNRKITILSFDTLREKVCNYLMDEYRKQKRRDILLPLSRKEMAETLGVQRPSLSREFINMKDEGLIDFDKNRVTLLDIPALEDYLY